jgi:prevent-host-death family protein
MKIVVSVNELSAETQLVIDNMRRSKAPVLVGDAAHPQAVLISYEEYERLQRQAQAASAPAPQPVAATPAPAPRPEPVVSKATVVEEDATQPIAPSVVQPSGVSREAAAAEVVPTADHSDVAKRTAAAPPVDRVPSEPRVVSQRPTTIQPDPELAAKPSPAVPQRAARLTKPMPRGLPKPPRPLETPRPQSSALLNTLLANWQTIVLVIGVLLLGIVGLALIANAFG